MSRSFKIIFMGTPEYAVPTLSALAASHHKVSLVVTQPDRPRGRGQIVTPPPVKITARKFGIDVVQPVKIKNPEFISRLTELQPDLLVVVAYGRILPRAVLEVPALGPVNVHASLLPKYRGAAPIQWAIIKGEKETGITTMLMDEGMDTGDILLTAVEPIHPEDTAATLHDRLARLGADTLLRTLEGLADGSVKPVPQEHARAIPAPMLKKADGHIDWHKPVEVVHNLIRGVTPWPGAYTFHNQNRLKIHKAWPMATGPSETPGTVLEGFDDELRIATADGVLCVQEIQAESGKRLPINTFLQGYPLVPGTLLE
jgi:methionyl-tRNA formyltransferase